MDNTARIDRYLSGDMEVGEKQAFESELASDPALAEELALQRDMAVFLQRKDRRSALKEQLKGLGNEYFKQPKEPAKVVSLPRRRLLWTVAASAAVVLALIVAWQFLFNPSLYDQYARYPALALAEKSTDGPMDWSRAEEAFNTGDYATAETLLAQYLDQFPGDQLALLYLGICRMELDRLDEARQIFRGLATADASIKDYADWYLALSFLKSGDKASCLEVLQQISPSSSLYGKSRELTKELKE